MVDLFIIIITYGSDADILSGKSVELTLVFEQPEGSTGQKLYSNYNCLVDEDPAFVIKLD